jgi:DNA gyrase subunit B
MVEIEILPGLESVRRNADMYVGPVNSPGVLNVLIQEAICLSLDDVAEGKCTRISISISDDHSVSIRDNGPGISMTLDNFGETLAQHLFTKMYACREYKRSAHLKGRCCGVGIAAVNALCDRFRVRNCIDGICWIQEYRCGIANGPFLEEGETQDSGLEINFEPDQTILTNLQFSRPRLIAWVNSTGVGPTAVHSWTRNYANGAQMEFVVN